MITHKLQRKPRLSRKEAYDLVITMAQFSECTINHQRNEPFTILEEVKEVFQAAGYEFDNVVEECRNPQSLIPLFENLIGSTFYVFGGSQPPETVITSNFLAAYETAEEYIEQAIAKASFSELESAVVRGIGSMESYLNGQVGIWNKTNPTKTLTDSRDNKVSFDDKIDKWIPIMTDGQKLNKSRHWSDFKRLRGIRDNFTVHPKTTGIALNYLELADLINRFNTGIAGVIIDLHVVFRNWVPSGIIRGFYAPKVQVVKME